MKIIINNAEEAEMPAEMIKNCEKLLEWRIEEMPEVGEELEVLYSEKDPLMESEEIDETAYHIYFTVTEIEPADETHPENATFYFDLVF
jgi:hypothetical protein